MLKTYEMHGKTWQFEDGEQPSGAREVVRPEAKARAPRDKSRKPAEDKAPASDG